MVLQVTTEKSLKLLFPAGMVVLFLLLLFRPLREGAVLVYVGLKWLCILIFLYSAIVSLLVLARDIKKGDFRGAIGVLGTILVFSILIFLLLSCMSLL